MSDLFKAILLLIIAASLALYLFNEIPNLLQGNPRERVFFLPERTP